MSYNQFNDNDSCSQIVTIKRTLTGGRRRRRDPVPPVFHLPPRGVSCTNWIPFSKQKLKERHLSMSTMRESFTSFSVASEQDEHRINIVDVIELDGEIECKCNIQFKSTTIQQMIIRHNFYNQISSITQLTMCNFKPSNDITTIYKQCNKSLYAINMKLTSNEVVTQWIEIILKCDENVQYSFDIKIFITSITSSSLFWSKNIFTTNISTDPHNIKKYVFYQSLVEFHHLYFPNDIISIIFDLYFTKYFHIYGEPFIHDTLQLNDCQTLLNSLDPAICEDALKGHEYSSNPDYIMKEAFIFTSNEAKRCNINGIGIQLSIDEGYGFQRQFLIKYDIDPSDLTAIWSMHSVTSLSKLKALQTEINKSGNIGNPNVYAQLLLDINVLSDSFFMLWIKWEKEFHQKQFEVNESEIRRLLRTMFSETICNEFESKVLTKFSWKTKKCEEKKGYWKLCKNWSEQRQTEVRNKFWNPICEQLATYIHTGYPIAHHFRRHSQSQQNITMPHKYSKYTKHYMNQKYKYHRW